MRFRQVCQKETDEEVAIIIKVQFYKEQRSGERAKGQQERTPQKEGDIVIRIEPKEKQVEQKGPNLKEQGEKPQESQRRAGSCCGSDAATGRVLPAAWVCEDLPAAAGGRHVSAHERRPGLECWYASFLSGPAGPPLAAGFPPTQGGYGPGPLKQVQVGDMVGPLLYASLY